MRLLTVFACVGLTASALVAPAVLSSPAQAADRSATPAMVALVEVMAHRVEIADTVAAAKWGTTQPIEDPAREKAVLDSAAAQAPGLGVDPAAAVLIFSDQIAANKVVQYGLFSRWTAHPDQAPTDRPDLALVRPILNAITGQLLAELHTTQAQRADRHCARQLRAAEDQVADTHDFDRLHTEALHRASTSICA